MRKMINKAPTLYNLFNTAISFTLHSTKSNTKRIRDVYPGENVLNVGSYDMRGWTPAIQATHARMMA